MYVESVPNRDSPPAVLLRESYREEGKVKKRTLANLSRLARAADRALEGVAARRRGRGQCGGDVQRRALLASRPCGGRAGLRAACALEQWLGAAPQELQPLLLAMLVARVIAPASKLATHRLLHDDTAEFARPCARGGSDVPEDLYKALDWLHEAQPVIERRLARQHLRARTLVLYDLTSTWLTGRCCELAARGYIPRRQARRSADRLWPDLHRRGLSDRGGGVPGQHGGPGHGGRAGRQAARALRHRAHHLGRRPRHAHLRTHRTGAQAQGAGLGQQPARASDRATRGRAWTVPAHVVR